jgi:RimJ/RimL family protein N-acetyltransferase
VIDLDRGWRTERLDLEPLVEAHATEAAGSLVGLLHAAGWAVVAYIHPGHLASQRVARAAGLAPAGEVRDGELRWARPG